MYIALLKRVKTKKDKEKVFGKKIIEARHNKKLIKHSNPTNLDLTLAKFNIFILKKI